MSNPVMITSEQAIKCYPHHVGCDCHEWDHQQLQSRIDRAEMIIDLLRTGRDGKKYNCVKSRSGSFVYVNEFLAEREG